MNWNPQHMREEAAKLEQLANLASNSPQQNFLRKEAQRLREYAAVEEDRRGGV